ncbi:TetR/AcrR family transcriptional regulator [Clostridium hydrogenum]|uniref:TetR/AcrR family transcriptional regulator n=1 Tax=Clostridium hydrogenum TaxID=2855764 RepID=UPI001F1F8EAF|nr:TetR/AcrR family transcriptional regulator [Clostridium hydrogenum]
MKKLSIDHRTRVTKLLIRKAFINILEQKPIQSISIKELCCEAQINRGTFYNHYTDIYDLLKQIEDELQLDFEKALEPLNHIEDELTSTVVIAKIFKYIKENIDLYVLTLGEHGDKLFTLKLMNMGKERFIDRYSNNFKSVSKERMEYFCVFISSGCLGILQKWVKDGMVTSVEEVAKTAEDIVIMAIGTLE